MRVLVVEDDRALGLFLKKGLEMDGHQVAWVGDGDEALRQVAAEPPELMVLDLNLPRRDGTEVLELVHRSHASISVLVLTGRNKVEDRVRCLNLGADDCMVKPFSFHELTARCRAMMRRRGQNADPVLRCGELMLNRMERTVDCAGRVVELTVKEFALLEFLMLHQGNCVSRAMLLDEVWHMSPQAGTNVIDVYINYLRRKLAVPPGGAGGVWIETVRGLGYRVRDAAAELAQVSAEIQEGTRSYAGAHRQEGTHSQEHAYGQRHTDAAMVTAMDQIEKSMVTATGVRTDNRTDGMTATRTETMTDTQTDAEIQVERGAAMDASGTGAASGPHASQRMFG